MDHSHHSMHHDHGEGTTSTFVDGTTVAATDHSGHDSGHGAGGHGAGGHMSMDHMMKMYFHTTFGDTVLFQNWVLMDGWDTMMSCVGFLLIAILYEALKAWRQKLFKKSSSSSVFVIQQNGSPSSLETNGGDRALTNERNRRNVSNGAHKMLSSSHLIQTVLHMVQVLISYTLMLGFMTFNVWICISILIGAGLGYFLFCWRKITVVDVTEHCH